MKGGRAGGQGKMGGGGCYLSSLLRSISLN